MTQAQQASWLGDVAATAPEDTRADFIRKTYAHLGMAVGAFILIEMLIFQLFDTAAITGWMVGEPMSWLIVLGLFIGMGWVARWWAESSTSMAMQYAGLGLGVLAWAVVFVPILHIAAHYYDGAILTAAIAAAGVFGAITAFAFISGKDFSFLGGILSILAIAALVLIVLSLLMGFELGLLFVVAMIVLAGGFVLYDTSNVIHHYRIGQHVAAALALFASLALLFWYMLRLVMILTGRE